MRWLIPLAIVAAGVAAYLNSFSGVFLLDDEHRIVTSMQIRQLWPPSIAMAQSSRPLVQLSLAVNYALGGLDVRGYHALNLAIHLLAGLVLFGIVRRMLESANLAVRDHGTKLWLAATVACVWTVHPLQTESVTYIIQRGESMMGLFFLLTLYCAIRGSSSARPLGWHIGAVTACVLGMLSKEVMAVAPLIVLLYDRLFISPSYADAVRRRAGLYVGLAASWLVLAALLGREIAEQQVMLVGDLTPWRYLLTEFGVVLHYVRLVFWPHPLVLDYAWPMDRSPASIALSAAVVLTLVAATVLAIARRYWAGFWAAWFFLILAPTSSVYPISDVAFEHRMYLPLAGVIVLAVVFSYEALEAGLVRLDAPHGLRRSLQGGLALLAVIALASGTVRRNEDYASEMTMWADVATRRPDNPRAHNNLGNALARSDRPREAVAEFVEALRLKPDYADANFNLGTTELNQGQIGDAVKHLSRALDLEPRLAKAHVNLGAALVRQRKIDDALGHFTEALRLDPNDGDAHNNLGAALVSQRQYAEGAKHLLAAVRLNAASADSHYNLGIALTGQGKAQGAVAQYMETLRLQPDHAAAHLNLGAALFESGKLDEAIAHYTAALRANPNQAEAHANLGAALARQGKLDEALAHYSEALRIDPGLEGARIDQARILARLGRPAPGR